MQSNLVKRTITGVLFIIVLINRTITSLGGAYLCLALMGFCTQATDARVFLPYLALLLYMMITELYLKHKNPLGNWAFSMMSQLYVALPFALLNVLAFHNDPAASSVSYNPILPLSIFVFIWLSDTGAYCVGSLIGKHRLFERISPKKSWEGSIGGAVFPMGRAGCSSGHLRHMGRPDRIAHEAPAGHQGFGQYSARPWRHARPLRQRSDGYPRRRLLPVCTDAALKDFHLGQPYKTRPRKLDIYPPSGPPTLHTNLKRHYFSCTFDRSTLRCKPFSELPSPSSSDETKSNATSTSPLTEELSFSLIPFVASVKFRLLRL